MRTRTLILSAALVVVSPTFARAAECWEFESASQKRAAEDRYRSYWNENYKVAVELLKGAKSKEKLEEAILRLKLAVDKNPRSDTGGVDPITREPLVYVPYYYLGLAHSQRGNYDLALGCLDKETKKISTTKLAKDFAALRASLMVRSTSDALLARADQVLGWEREQGEVVLSREGRGRIAGIRQQREALARAADADVTGAFERLRGGLKDFLGQEVRAGSERFAQIGVAQACAPPVDDGSIQALDRGLSAVVDCNRRVTQALRTTAQKECKSLADLREEARRLSEELQQWAERQGDASPPRDAVPDQPASCAGLAEAPPARVHEAYAALENEKAGARQALSRSREELSARAAAKRKQWAEKVDAALELLPELPADCAQALQVKQAVAKAREIRGRLAQWRSATSGVPPHEAMNPVEFVGVERNRLLEQVEKAVQQMQQNSSCPGIDAASLNALPGAVASFKADSAQAVPALCGAAKTAAAEVQTCWSRNLPYVRQRAGTMVTVLEAARSGRRSGAAALGAQGALSCLDEKAATLRTVRTAPAATAAEWVPRALADLAEANECLLTFHAAAKGAHARFLEDIRSARETADSSGLFPSDAGGSVRPGEGSLENRVRRMAQELESVENGIDRLSSLYGGSAPGCSRVREIVRGAGLEQSLPAEARGLLAEAKEDDGALDATACLALADAAMLESLAAAGETLARWEPLIQAMGPFAALSWAYEAFTAGNLDAAILALRHVLSGQRIPAQGRQAALVHATLSYLLYAKSTAVSASGGDRDLAEHLLRDCRDQARLAKRADPGLRLPETLFPSRRFRDMVWARARAEQPQGG